MERKLVLILGGARSGKSAYALKMAQEAHGKVLFVATAEGEDEEMVERIEHHREERPSAWHTLEAPLHVGEAIRVSWNGEETILLDCLTLLAGNVLGRIPEPYDSKIAQAMMDEELDNILDVYRHLDAIWLVVSNEVGLGIVPAYPLGRIYRDVLGRANQRLAAEADEVIFMVAGLVMRVK